MIILETKRLVLRHITFDDAPFILRLLNEPSFLKNVGDKKIRSLEGAKKDYILAGPMDSYKKNGFGLDCVEIKESKKIIGVCGLIKRPVLKNVDIGYAFLPEFWSNGYAREAVLGVLTHTKKNLDINTVAAIVNSDNEGSINVLEKLGFIYQKMIMLPEGEKKVKLYFCNL